MTDKSPSDQAQDLLAKWNPPPQDHLLERVVGVPTEPGDVAATAHVPHEGAGTGPSSDSVDAQRAFADDLDDEQPDFDDVTVEQLKRDLAAAGKPVSGNKQELYDRLYNESDDDGDDDSEEDEDDE